MGGHRGGSYSVADNGPEQFNENVEKVIDRFRIEHGRFGVMARKKKNIRRIYSDDPARDAKFFYQTLGRGGELREMENGAGVMRWFKGGTLVKYRPAKSSDGTPVIEIVVQSSGSSLAPYQKIHFVKGADR